MAQFYKELQELRVSKEISLEELETRTKINIRYLQAIEDGKFDILPVPYLRLFLRAYSTEIGGDSERALEQLDSFIGNSRSSVKPSIKNVEIKQNESTSSKLNITSLLSDSNLKLRRDIITVIILSALFIFSIVIIKKIFSNEVNYPSKVVNKNNIKKVKLITEEDLITNYAEDKFIEESLSIEPPFFLTILANNYIGISIEQDTLKPYVEYLNPGTEIHLKGFISNAELLFTNTNKIKIRLNGMELTQIINHAHPLRLIIKSSPTRFNAKLYKPII
tara:strand:- start:469 stop:1299 length:831 start_codon:yes stop_codon:yes gene_type:complete